MAKDWRAKTARKSDKLQRRWDEQGGRCYWCDEVMLPPSMNRSFGNSTLPLNAATAEHLYPKGDPRRTAPAHDGSIRIVAACYECNRDRGRFHAEVVLAAGDSA